MALGAPIWVRGASPPAYAQPRSQGAAPPLRRHPGEPAPSSTWEHRRLQEPPEPDLQTRVEKHRRRRNRAGNARRPPPAAADRGEEREGLEGGRPGGGVPGRHARGDGAGGGGGGAHSPGSSKGFFRGDDRLVRFK